MDDASRQTLQTQAIDAALCCDWQKAIELNKQLNEQDPENPECLNRLARAYFELGSYQESKKIYQQVLKIDPYNSNSQKNLKMVSAFKKDETRKKNGEAQNTTISPALFLEESGITKVIPLIKVAEPQKISKLHPGALVKLVTKSRSISVIDYNDNYLGVLPDDIAHLLLKLIKGGNKYQVLVKSVKLNGLTILIRETFRSKKFRNQSSFLDSSQVNTYSSDHISLLLDDTQDEIPDIEGEESTA